MCPQCNIWNAQQAPECTTCWECFTVDCYDGLQLNEATDWVPTITDDKDGVLTFSETGVSEFQMMLNHAGFTMIPHVYDWGTVSCFHDNTKNLLVNDDKIDQDELNKLLYWLKHGISEEYNSNPADYEGTGVMDPGCAWSNCDCLNILPRCSAFVNAAHQLLIDDRQYDRCHAGGN